MNIDIYSIEETRKKPIWESFYFGLYVGGIIGMIVGLIMN
jgi:hypothetical protein